jgi:hypothetical protein
MRQRFRLLFRLEEVVDHRFSTWFLLQIRWKHGRLHAVSISPKKPAVSDSGLGALERFVVRTVCQAASFGRICRL